MYSLKPAEGLSFLCVVCPGPAWSSAAASLSPGTPSGAVVGPADWLRAGAAPSPGSRGRLPGVPNGACSGLARPQSLGSSRASGPWARQPHHRSAPGSAPPIPPAAPKQDSSLAAFFSPPLAWGPVTRCLFSPKQGCPGAPRPQLKSDQMCSLTGPGQPRRWGVPGLNEDKSLRSQILLHTPLL